MLAGLRPRSGFPPSRGGIPNVGGRTALAQTLTFSRTCPLHFAEVLFRPNPRNFGFDSVPWCYVADHVCRAWRVTDQHGRIWASATRTKVRLWFDVDSLFGELLSVREPSRRTYAQPKRVETVEEAVA